MANEQIVNDGFLYINELKISNDATTPNSIIDIGAGQCRDSTNVYDMILSAPTTASTAFIGIGGLDTGTVAASTVYAVYLISDPIMGNPTSCILSTSLTGPIMPFNYAAFRLIGYCVTDGSMHILKAYIAGNNNSRMFMYDAPISVGTTASEAAYTAIALTKFVPAVNNIPVYLNASIIGGSAGDTLKLQPGNATGDAVTIVAAATTYAFQQQVVVLSQLVSSVPTINYKNSGTDTIAILVDGFNFYI